MGRVGIPTRHRAVRVECRPRATPILTTSLRAEPHTKRLAVSTHLGSAQKHEFLQSKHLTGAHTQHGFFFLLKETPDLTVIFVRNGTLICKEYRRKNERCKMHQTRCRRGCKNNLAGARVRQMRREENVPINRRVRDAGKTLLCLWEAGECRCAAQ